jgi:hypothetical protein
MPVSDNYLVWVRVRSPSADNQRYFIDPGTGNWIPWEAGIHPTWSWVKVTDSTSGLPALYALKEGFNTFSMGWCDDNVQVDRILITNDLNFDPSLATPVDDASIFVYPNPASDEFIIKYTSVLSQQADVGIYDMASRLIKQSLVSVDIGQNDILVDIHDLSNGIYIVSFLINGQNKSMRLAVLR